MSALRQSANYCIPASANFTKETDSSAAIIHAGKPGKKDPNFIPVENLPVVEIKDSDCQPSRGQP